MSDDGYDVTKNFLTEIIRLSIEFIKQSNDRKEKVLDFKQPNLMLKILDLDITNEPKDLQQLIDDCDATFKNQVKMGEYRIFFFALLRMHSAHLQESPKFFA